jgi:hypothetical protein
VAVPISVEGDSQLVVGHSHYAALVASGEQTINQRVDLMLSEHQLVPKLDRYRQ